MVDCLTCLTTDVAESDKKVVDLTCKRNWTVIYRILFKRTS